MIGCQYVIDDIPFLCLMVFRYNVAMHQILLVEFFVLIHQV